MKLTPRSMARWRAAREVLSSVGPQARPPMPQAPKPMAEMFQPVRPKVRYSIGILGMPGTGDSGEMKHASTSKAEAGGFGGSLAGSCEDAGAGGSGGSVGVGRWGSVARGWGGR